MKPALRENAVAADGTWLAAFPPDQAGKHLNGLFHEGGLHITADKTRHLYQNAFYQKIVL